MVPGFFATATTKDTPEQIATAVRNALAIAVARGDNAQSKTPEYRYNYVPAVLLHEIDCCVRARINFVYHNRDLVQRRIVVGHYGCALLTLLHRQH